MSERDPFELPDDYFDDDRARDEDPPEDTDERFEEEPQEGPGVPEDFDPDWGGDDEKVEDPCGLDAKIERLLDAASEIDRCCRAGCRGCDKLMPEAKPEPDTAPPGLGNEPPF